MRRRRPPRRHLTRGTRTALIAVHSTASSIWLGMLVVLGLSDMAELRTRTPDGALDGLTGALVAWVLVPDVAAVLGTGVILAAASAWGLTRYWWLLGKLFIAAVLSVYGLAAMLTATHTMCDRLVAAAALAAATVLSVVKPWGRVPFTAPRRKAVPG